MTASASDWSRVKALFAQALDQPASARDAWLASACDDDEVLAEVRSLLLAQAAPNSHLLADGIERLIPPLLLDDDPLIDSRVGPYRLLRLLGEGGMGRVFLAERADGEFRQQVALKLMRAGFASNEINERFLRERELLARLAHPNIALLHDGGVSPDNLPYFTLEHVEGESISTWCDDQRLSVAGRLRLVLKVCDAVQYAHRNLIVHRDLKPSNILVTAGGEPKLLDFGIAKVIDAGSERGLTQTLSQPMTREYAAPEQVLGEPITTATDVYALGVLLYELLTGRLPYARAERGETSWAKAIVEEPAEPMASAMARSEARAAKNADAAVADARSATFAALRRTLRGDLDRIVQRALEKAPEARYPSVAALAEDIKAFLEGRSLPGGSRRYRVAKFLRRHQVGVAMTVLTIALAAAGMGGIVWQARETSREAQAASAVKDFLLSLFTASSPNEARGRDIGVRELLDRGRAQIERNLAAQPGLRSELQGVLGRIYFQLGLYDQAEVLQRSALEAPRRSGQSDADTIDLQRQLSETLAARGKLAEAEPLIEAAAAALDSGQNDPTERVHVLITRSTIAQRQGNAEAAERFAMQAAALARSPSIPPDLLGNALSAQGLADWDLRKVAESEALYREALRIHRAAFGDLDLRVATDRQNLTLALRNLGRYEEALEQARLNVRIREKILGDNHPDLSRALFTLGTTLYHMARYEEAEKVLRRGVAVARASLGDNPITGTALNNLGLVLMDWHGLDEAEQVYTEALRIDTALLGPNHNSTLITASNLADVHARQGKLEQAESELRDVLARDRSAGIKDEVWELNRLGDVRRQRGDWHEAIELHRQALAQSIALFAPNGRQSALSHYYLGLALVDAGRKSEAAIELRAAIAAWRVLLPPDGEHPFSASARLALGKLLVTEPSSRDEGLRLMREAAAIRERFLGPADPRTVETRQALASVVSGPD
jgi:serine/threonine-protein kinase